MTERYGNPDAHNMDSGPCRHSTVVQCRVHGFGLASFHAVATTAFLPHRVITLALMALVGACAPAASATGSGDFAGPVDTGGGRSIYLVCRGQGSASVILEVGPPRRSRLSGYPSLARARRCAARLG